MKPTEKSTLATPGVFDQMFYHLRDRARASGYDIDDGYCARCQAKLTEADIELSACTQCGKPLSTYSEDEQETEL